LSLLGGGGNDVIICVTLQSQTPKRSLMSFLYFWTLSNQQSRQGVTHTRVELRERGVRLHDIDVDIGDLRGRGQRQPIAISIGGVVKIIGIVRTNVDRS
jgi:hypothetical protein